MPRLIILSAIVIFSCFDPVLTVNAQSPDTTYQLAFVNFGPLNTDLFIADANGSNARPLLAHPGLDYNASFSHDGNWVLFTSERNGSADIYRVHPDGAGLEQLTNDPSFDDQAALSWDGKFLAFVSTRNGQADIYILELASKKITNVTHHPAGDFRPAWSPDGQWIAFSSDRDSKKPIGNGGFETSHSTEIYVARPDGSALRRVTQQQGLAGSPAWSADSRQLIIYETITAEVNKITSVRQLTGTTQITAVDVATNERHVLTTGTGTKLSPCWLPGNRFAYVTTGAQAGIELSTGPAERGEFNGPSWSADGRQVVFFREVEQAWPPFKKVYTRDKQFQLVRSGVFPSFSPLSGEFICNDQKAALRHNSVMRMDADGNNRRVLLTDSLKNILCPTWSPRGDKIAFSIGTFFQSINGRAKADIGIINRDGSGLTILTDSSCNAGFPSWSTDGKKIVYRVSSDSLKGLFIIDIATHAVKQLTFDDHGNFPSWSPAADVIAFTSKRDGDFEIYTIKADGTGLKRLTNAPGNDAHCSWSPDGKWIAFSSARGGFKDESALHPANPQPYGDIYVMRADGSDVRMLTDNQYEEGTPAWMPVKLK